MRDKLKKELKSAFEAPAPVKKDIFLNQINYPKAGRIDFIISQLGYMGKHIWIISVLIFLTTLYCLYVCRVQVSLVWIFSSILPFISLISISEIIKSSRYKMEELEMSCKYNFLEVSLVRMGILGVTDLFVLTGIILLFKWKTDLSFIRLGLYFTTPYLLTCYGSLLTINRLRSRETMYVCGTVTIFVSMLNAVLSMQVKDLYTESYSLIWLLAFICLAILSARELAKLIKKMEELQWNSSLTV